MSNAGQQVVVAPRATWAQQAPAATRVARVEAPSRTAALALAALGVLLLWSVSYLARQAGIDTVSPAVTLRAAVEGMALAVAWLAALVGACTAVLTGAVVLRQPGDG